MTIYTSLEGIPKNSYFIGIILVSSSQRWPQFRLFPMRIYDHLSIKNIFNLITIAGRIWNGHTALIYGKEGNPEGINGWDPSDALEVVSKSLWHGKDHMGPVNGVWRDDKKSDMHFDRTRKLMAIQVNEGQYKEFIKGIEFLKNGGHTNNKNIQFAYSFKPSNDMKKYSSLESNSKEIKDNLIISNCGDAAIHFLVTWLYSWEAKDKTTSISKFREILCTIALKNPNFSQGELMKKTNELSAIQPTPKL